MAGVRSGVAKLTTGLTGVKVSPKPHETLRVLYNKVLGHLQRYPQESKYRISTEQVIKMNLDHVNNTPDREALEKKFGGIQLEEAIIAAEREVILAKQLHQFQPWQKLAAEPPPGQYDWPPQRKHPQK